MPEVTGYPRDPEAADKKKIEQCLELLRQGQDHRRTVREDIWQMVIKQYRGDHWSDAATEDPTADLTVVNMSFATIQTIKPYITGQEPKFHLEPFSSDATRLSAALQEVFLNRLWRHPPVGAQAALKSATFDYLLLGDGFTKATYGISQTYGGDEGEPNDKAHVFVDRVTPWDVWIDPYSDAIDNARWVAHRIWLTEDEAKLDQRLSIPSSFEFTDDREIAAESVRSNAGLSAGQRWVELVEFYDVTNGVMYCFPISGSDAAKTAADIPWQVVEEKKVPLVQMPNYDINDSPWHMGDLEQIGKLQHELNKTRSELMTHRRRNRAKVAIRKGAFGDDAIVALQSPIVNEIVEIDSQEPLQNVLSVIQLQPISSDNYQASNEIKDDIREITGVTEYQRGIAPEITRTATEASIMDAASNVKLQSKLSSVEEAARRLGVIILGIAREIFPNTAFDEWAMFIGGDEAQRLARLAQSEAANTAMNENNYAGAADIASQQLPTEVEAVPSPEMFKGEYEVLVEIGSTEYRDPKLREERLRNMFFEIADRAPMLAQMGVNVDLNKILRSWLESTDILDVDAMFQQQVPVEQAAQMPPEAGGPQPEQVPPGMNTGGGIPPELAQMIGNTGMLDTGQVSPNALVGGEPV